MLVLYKDTKSLCNKLEFINEIDLRFDKEIYSLTITDVDKSVMSCIDNARYIGNGYIETLFGVTEVQNLSTGCKTLILINHAKDLGYPVINIGECGKNVLDYIFSMENIKVYLGYCSIPNKYNKDKVIQVVKAGTTKEMKLKEVFNKVWR